MRLFATLWWIFLLLLAGPAQAQNFTPITVTGYNHDIFAEAFPDAFAATDTVLDATSHIMYTQAFASAAGLSGGLVNSGAISDGSGLHQYQLAPYNGTNALTLMRGVTRAFTLPTPAAYGKLSLLAFSTEGPSTVNISVSFTDGTSTSYLSNYSLKDWFANTTNVVISGFGRCRRVSAAPYSMDGYPADPRFYYIDITLNCTDVQKQVQQVVLTNATTTGFNAPFPNAVFLALAGTSYQQAVTSSSTPATCGATNGSATVSVTGNTGPYTIGWNTTPAQSGGTATNLAAGSYTATITNASGCSTTQTVTVQQQGSAVTVTATASPMAVCSGSNAQLSVSATGGTLSTYNWSPGSLSGASVTVNPAATTTYTVSGQDQFGCAYSQSVTVAVTPPPATPSAANTSTCPGTQVTLMVQNPQAGDTYNWYAAASGGTPLGTGTSFQTPVINATTSYFLEATGSTGCVQSTRAEVAVTVTPPPPAPSAGDAAICPGTQATLNVTSPQAGYTYNWYSAASGGAPLFTGTSFQTPVINATTSYYLEVMGGTGCVQPTRTQVTVTVNPPPAPPVVNPVAICPGSSATLDISSPQAGYTYSWYSAASGGTAIFTGTSMPTGVLSVSTAYYLDAVSASGCSSSSRSTVTVSMLQPLPSPVVTVSAITSSSLTFSWPAVANAAGYEVSIDGGASFTPPSTGTTGLSHTVANLIPGQSITIVVRALGQQSCQNSALSAPVTAIVPDKNLFVPNVFTPNGDGNNDVLRVYSNSIATMEFRIFNQWGNEVFATTTPMQGWDGRYKGQPQPVGVYVYVLRVVLTDGTAINKKGSISLLR